MALNNYKTKASVVVVFTGEGKGKTSASLGMLARALGAGWQVAYIQFIKNWQVSEHSFIKQIAPIFNDKLFFYQSGGGFYNADSLSAKNISKVEHKNYAALSLQQAQKTSASGQYDLVICDEINNAVNDGLVTIAQLENLIKNKFAKTSLCLTGRNFPHSLLKLVDIATDMQKLKHHYDEKYLANLGIDY